MLTTDPVAVRPDPFTPNAEIDRYSVDADFDTTLDDLQREFAEHLDEDHA